MEDAADILPASLVIAEFPLPVITNIESLHPLAEKRVPLMKLVAVDGGTLQTVRNLDIRFEDSLREL